MNATLRVLVLDQLPVIPQGVLLNGMQRHANCADQNYCQLQIFNIKSREEYQVAT